MTQLTLTKTATLFPIAPGTIETITAPVTVMITAKSTNARHSAEENIGDFSETSVTMANR